MSQNTQPQIERVLRPRGLPPIVRGKLAARYVGSLVGMPYGPGWRQVAYIKGFQQERGDAPPNGQH